MKMETITLMNFKNENRFFLKINLPVGNYSFIAKTDLNDKTLIDSGKLLSVPILNPESQKEILIF